MTRIALIVLLAALGGCAEFDERKHEAIRLKAVNLRLCMDRNPWAYCECYQAHDIGFRHEDYRRCVEARVTVPPAPAYAPLPCDAAPGRL